MEWYRRYTDRHDHRQIQKAGFWAVVAFDAICDVNAFRDFGGEVPAEYAEPDYLAHRIGLSDQDCPGGNAAETLCNGLKRAIVTGLLTGKQDGSVVIDGWARKQPRVGRTSAERVKDHRERKRLAKLATAAVTDVTVVTNGNADVTKSARVLQKEIKQSREDESDQIKTPQPEPSSAVADQSVSSPALTQPVEPPRPPPTKPTKWDAEVALVVEAWRAAWGKDGDGWVGSSKEGKKRRKAIEDRLAEGIYPAADLVLAMEGSPLDPWADRKNNCDIRQLLATARNLDLFIRLAKAKAIAPQRGKFEHPRRAEWIAWHRAHRNPKSSMLIPGELEKIDDWHLHDIWQIDQDEIAEIEAAEKAETARPPA